MKFSYLAVLALTANAVRLSDDDMFDDESDQASTLASIKAAE